jgi:hypothetical protein
VFIPLFEMEEGACASKLDTVIQRNLTMGRISDSDFDCEYDWWYFHWNTVARVSQGSSTRAREGPVLNELSILQQINR